MTSWRPPPVWRQRPNGCTRPAHPRLPAAWFLIPLLALVVGIPRAAAFGRAEEEAKIERAVKEAEQWVFCVVTFDVTELPASQRVIGDLSAKRLARAIESVRIRRRSMEEVGAYSDYADAEAREAAGKVLAEKRAVRAGLLYQGNPGWKYRKELIKADTAVEEAEKAFVQVEEQRFRVDIEGRVVLSERNKGGVLPPMPKAAEIPAFCKENKLDAILMGSVSPFYGRIRLKTQLYSRFLRRVIHEDEIVFSSEDREDALAELEGRLKSAVGGLSPAVLAISSEPQEADIVVDGSLLGHGEVGPIEKTPVPTKIEVSAPFHETAELTADLASDELTRVSVKLRPFQMTELSVEARASSIEPVGQAEVADVAVRMGAMYVGAAPFTVSVPAGRMVYVAVETKDGLGASAVVSEGGLLVLDLKPLPGADAKPVEAARKKFYNAFGRFSVALPIAFFLSGLATGYENAAVWGGEAEKEEAADITRRIANVAVATTVCFFLDSAIRFVGYLGAANKRATSSAKPVPVGNQANLEKER